MTPRVSVHIGVSQPEWSEAVWSPLSTPVSDAMSMFNFALTRSYEPILRVKPEDTTVEAVRKGITTAAATVRSGGDMLLTFSGHGAKDRGNEPHREPDRLDDYWVLHDGALCDNFWQNLWAQCSSDTRIVVIADACYGLGSNLTTLSRLLENMQLQGPENHAYRLRFGSRSHCVDLDPRFPDDMPTGVVVIGPGRDDSYETEPFLTQALIRVLNERPPSFADLVRKSEQIAQKPVGGRCYGKGGRQLWGSEPLG